jgi:hypothetical protein
MFGLRRANFAVSMLFGSSLEFFSSLFKIKLLLLELLSLLKPDRFFFENCLSCGSSSFCAKR